MHLEMRVFREGQMVTDQMKAVHRCAIWDVKWVRRLLVAMPARGWFGSSAEEGRAKQRYAPGRCKEPLIRGCPNGTPDTSVSIRKDRERPELKHLSRGRRRNQLGCRE